MSKISPIIIVIVFLGGLFGFMSYKSSSKKTSRIEMENQSNSYQERIRENNKKIEKEKVVDNIEKKSGYENIEEISLSELKDITKRNKKYILILTGEGCSHCRAYKPVLNDILGNNNLTAYEVEVWSLSKEEVEDLKTITGPYEGVPVTFVMSGDRKIDSIIGGIDRSRIIDFLTVNGFIEE